MSQWDKLDKIIAWLATNDANTENISKLIISIDAKNTVEHKNIIDVLEKKVSLYIFSWSIGIIASLMAFFFAAHVEITAALAHLTTLEEIRHDKD